MDLLLTLLAFAATFVLAAIVGLLGLAYLGSTLAGRLVERIFDFVVPDRGSRIGAASVVGRRAGVVDSFVPSADRAGSEGTVRVSGELWNAFCEGESDVAAGSAVRVVAVEELLLLVEKE